MTDACLIIGSCCASRVVVGKRLLVTHKSQSLFRLIEVGHEKSILSELASLHKQLSGNPAEPM